MKLGQVTWRPSGSGIILSSIGPVMASECPAQLLLSLLGPLGVSGAAPLTFLTPHARAAQVAAAGVALAVGPVHTGGVGPTGLWGTHRPMRRALRWPGRRWGPDARTLTTAPRGPWLLRAGTPGRAASGDRGGGMDSGKGGARRGWAGREQGRE